MATALKLLCDDLFRACSAFDHTEAVLLAGFPLIIPPLWLPRLVLSRSSLIPLLF